MHGISDKNDSAEDESLCRKCGRCCYAKTIVEGRVIQTHVPCRYLDTVTNLCTMYERRHEVNPHCLTVREGIEQGVFPADCPYVQGIEGYVPPIQLEEWRALCSNRESH